MGHRVYRWTGRSALVRCRQANKGSGGQTVEDHPRAVPKTAARADPAPARATPGGEHGDGAQLGSPFQLSFGPEPARCTAWLAQAAGEAGRTQPAVDQRGLVLDGRRNKSAAGRVAGARPAGATGLGIAAVARGTSVEPQRETERGTAALIKRGCPPFSARLQIPSRPLRIVIRPAFAIVSDA